MMNTNVKPSRNTLSMHFCTFLTGKKKPECGVLNVTPTEEYCRNCKFFKTHKQFEDGVKQAEKMLSGKGLQRAVKFDYNGDRYISVEPVPKI